MTTLMNQLQARIETAVNKTGTYNEALQNLANLYGVPQGETGSRLIPVVQVFDPTINNATAAQNYLLYNSTIVSGGVPSLGMDFTSGTLDPRITFTRASNATVVNSAGLISYAPHNLLTNSESFEAAAWTKTTGTTVVANAGTAPDATTTADRVVYDGTGTSGSFRIYQGNTISVLNQAYTCSVWMRADAPTTVRLYGNVVAGNHVTCNLTTTWQRFTTSGVGDGVASAQLLIYSPAADNSAISFYMWGAQLNVGPLQPYYFTTPKNLLGYTQEFDNAAWVKENVSVTANATSAPDGSATADTLVPSAISSNHQVYSPLISFQGQATISVYAKAAGYPRVSIREAQATGNGAVFDLSSGTVVSTTNATASILSVGNGWYRCSVVVAWSTNYRAGVTPLPAGATSNFPVYTGDGTSGVFVWGAQLSNSASVDPYVYNPGAAPTSVAYYGPRFDYDPVTLAPKGLLIEEQRTNLLTYSEDLSNAIWSKSAGATIGSNAIVAPDGNTTADNVTLAASGDYVYQAITATYSAGAAYTFSMYIKSANRAITWGGATPAGTDVYASTDVGNGWYRQSLTRTFTSAGTSVTIQTMLLGSQPAGLGPYAVWGAQLEAGAFATSYIPTVASQVTRSADNASMIGDNFANWFVQNSGSIFFELSRPLSGIRTPLQFGSSGANRYGPFFSGTLLNYFDGTSKPVGGNSNAGYTKIAGSVTNNDIAFSQDGGAAVAVATGVTKSGVDTFTIGSGYGFIASELLNGHIRRIMYYQTRLSNAQLQALTS